MLLPHIARHPARYLGTRVSATGAPVRLGRLAGTGPCTLWLDEGGIHFERPGGGGAFLLPRRCLQRAETRRAGLRTVVDVWWSGAGEQAWVSRFTARAGDRWDAAVDALKAATEQWAREARAPLEDAP